MTIEQANAYFASLPEGFAPARQLQEALSAKAGRVDYLGVAGTAGKTTAAALTAAVLRAAGLVTGSYHAGCEPLSARIRVNGEPVVPELLAQAAETLSARETLPRAAAELAAAARCFGEAGCALAVVELPDAGLAEALPKMPVCAVTSIGPDGISASLERSAALAAGVMRKGSICVTAPEQPKAVVSELIVAAGDIPDEAILEGLAAVENRSSIRVLSQRPLVVLDACRTPQQAIALLRVLNMAKVRHLSAVIGLAEEEGAEAFFSALESGLTAETQKKDRTTMPGMSENPFDKVFLVPPAGTDAAMTERLLEKARYHFDAELCGSLAEAVELARTNSRRGLLICGGEAIALEAADLLAEK